MGSETKRNVSVFGLVEVEFLFDGPARIKHLTPTCCNGQVPKMDVRQKLDKAWDLRTIIVITITVILLLDFAQVPAGGHVTECCYGFT